MALSVSLIGKRIGLCRLGMLEVPNTAGQDEEATGLIHCFPEGLLGLFESSCSAIFTNGFVADFSITCPVRFREVDVGPPWPINSGQYGVDGDEDGQMIAGQCG